MILYHVTDGVALVGDGGSLAAAKPGSILMDGILPAKSDDHDVRSPPMPACVWLSSDPDMSDDFCTWHGSGAKMPGMRR